MLEILLMHKLRLHCVWRFVNLDFVEKGLTMGEDQAAVISEQLGRLKDNIESRFQKIEALINHQNEISEERLRALRSEVGDLKKAKEDHETRIRMATEGVTQFKMYSGLANGGSGLLSIIALIKSFFGG
jgi:archaellum component FlaC